MREQFANNASTSLTAAITSTQTSFAPASVAAFPTVGQFRIAIDAEVMIVTAVAGGAFTVTRGAEGTVAAAHSMGAPVTHIITAGALANIVGNLVVHTGPADALTISDATIGNGSFTLTSASNLFTAAHVGKPILVVGAGAAGVSLVTTIAAVNGPGSVTLAASAPTAVTNANAAWGTDNGPTLQAELNAIAGTAITLVVPAASYLFATGVAIPSAGIRVSGYGATFISALAGTFFDTNSVLLLAQATSQGANLSITANVNIGDTSISIAGSSVAVGNTIQVAGGVGLTNKGGIYIVRKITGSNPQVCTVDRAFMHSFTTASCTVNVLNNPPQNISIEGLTFTGFCQRYVELINTRNTRARGLSFLDTVTVSRDAPISIDAFSYGGLYEDCTVDGRFPVGLAVEDNESTDVVRCRYFGRDVAGTVGFSSQANTLCSWQFCTATRYDAAGISFSDFDGISGVGNNYCTVLGGTYSGSPNGNGAGLLLNEAHDTVISGVTISGHAGPNGVGISLQTQVTGTKVIGCKVLNNLVGINIFQATQGTEITDCEVSGNSSTDVSCSGPAIIKGFKSISSGTTCIAIDDGNGGHPFVVVDGFDIALTVTSVGAGIDLQNGSVITAIVRNGRITMSGSSGGFNFGLIVNVGVCDIDNVVMSSSGAGYTGQGIATSAGSTLRLGSNVDVDGCTTPLGVSGYCSRSIAGSANANTVTLNGTTAVSVPWPKLKSTDRVLTSLHTRGSTPDTHAPLITYTPGTGFSVTGSIASTNDVVDYVLG